MPIPKELRHLYRGKAYEAFRNALLNRAGNACEQCKAPNGARVFRVQKSLKQFAGWWWDEILGVGHDPRGNPQPHLSHVTVMEEFGAELRGIKIVIGPAHQNHTPGDFDLSHSKALCQWCHLHFDLTMHVAHSRDTRCNRKDPKRPLLVLLEASA